MAAYRSYLSAGQSFQLPAGYEHQLIQIGALAGGQASSRTVGLINLDDLGHDDHAISPIHRHPASGSEADQDVLVVGERKVDSAGVHVRSVPADLYRFIHPAELDSRADHPEKERDHDNRDCGKLQKGAALLIPL